MIRNKKNNLFFILLFCMLFATNFYGQTSKQLKQKEKQLKEQIEQTKTLIDETKKTQSVTLSELTVINKQIAYRDELTKNLNTQVVQITTEITKNETQIALLKTELEKLKIEFREMIRFAYKQRNKDYNTIYILSSNSVGQAYRRMKYINQYAENRKLQAKEIKNTQLKLEQENKKLTINKTEKQVVINEAAEAKKTYLEDKSYQQKMLEKIKGEQTNLQQKLAEQQAEKDRIAKAIRDAIKKELAKKAKEEAEKNKNTTSNKNSPTKGFELSPEAKLVSQKFEENKGKLPWPVKKGTITGVFGRQQHSVVSSAYIENNGVDFSTSKNETIYVVFDGTVSSILTIPGSGKAIIISHGNYRTVYANLRDVTVEIGQKLKTGQAIGMLLANSTGAISESHFEIWKISGSNMQPVNPASWLQKR